MPRMIFMIFLDVELGNLNMEIDSSSRKSIVEYQLLIGTFQLKS